MRFERIVHRHGFGRWMLRHLFAKHASNATSVIGTMIVGYLLVVLPYFGVLALSVMILALLIRGVKLSRYARVHDALFSARCPACRYDLRGIDAAGAFDGTGRPMVGCEACPECGLPWPLLPPPIPPNAGSAARPS